MVSGAAVINAIKELFKMDEVTRIVSVETCVVLTTMLLVARFLLDFFGPRFMAPLGFNLGCVGNITEALSYSLVHYTIGLMQLSAARVNAYFQVWAVLLVTLQFSVKTGRPYSRSMQIPLLDIMSSLWAANLIRIQTFLLLRIPLWLTWALNAARIVSFFSSSEKSEAGNRESMRFVANYMSYEHKLGGSQISAGPPANEFRMKRYKYLILGEDQVLKDIQENLVPSARQVQEQENDPRRNQGCVLDPKDYENLITVDKIWDVDGGESGLLGTRADPANRLKDVCLSFALFKLLRRRFHDLPIHECRLQKSRRLVFDYILHDVERAFRVAGIELSFLQDLFYSKHGALFSAGFPTMNLVFSVLLIAATGYIAYPIRYIPERMDQEDHNRIIHGVFITRVIIIFIVVKELAEIYIYVFSQWTKILMLCSYAKRRSMRHPLVEMIMRVILRFMARGSWNEKISQQNLLISSFVVELRPSNHFISLTSMFSMDIKLEGCTKEAIVQSFKRLDKNPERLGSYFSNAFGAPGQPIHEQLRWAVELEADTHRILVWHIATCLCEISLASDRPMSVRATWRKNRPFVKKPEGTTAQEAVWWEHYTTAASLSNYCTFLVGRNLVTDNGILAERVSFEVHREINYVIGGIIGRLLRPKSMQDIFTHLMATIADQPDEHKQRLNKRTSDEEAPVAMKTKKEQRMDIKNTLTGKGAILGKQLMDAYGEDKIGLWETLASFWTGFLLHLASSTRAAKHRTRLAGTRELATHLWALLSHAGFLGQTKHGHTVLDPSDVERFNIAAKEQ